MKYQLSHTCTTYSDGALIFLFDQDDFRQFQTGKLGFTTNFARIRLKFHLFCKGKDVCTASANSSYIPTAVAPEFLHSFLRAISLIDLIPFSRRNDFFLQLLSRIMPEWSNCGLTMTFWKRETDCSLKGLRAQNTLSSMRKLDYWFFSS